MRYTSISRWAVSIILAQQVHATAVSWISPLTQDIYGPGSKITARWSCLETVASPSFKLCMLPTSQKRHSDPGFGSCGATVWPLITESAGVYEATVTVPDIPSSQGYYLQMKDNHANKLRSPVFTLSPDGASTAGTSSIRPEPPAAIVPQAQAPLGFDSPVSMKAPYPDSQTASPSIASATSGIPPALPTLDSSVLSAKPRPSTAAFAVPMSAVGAIVILASGLFLRRRRKRGDKCPIDTEKSGRRSRRGSLSSYKSHANKGPSELSYSRQQQRLGYGRPPASRFIPRDYHDSKREWDTSQSAHAFPQPTYSRGPPSYTNVSHNRGTSSRLRRERPRLPTILTTGFAGVNGGPHSHTLFDAYLPSSPSLLPHGSTPRCLLPAPEKVLARDDDGKYLTDKPPPQNAAFGRRSDDQELYDRVESKLDMYRRG
ncbi:hypothetical protein C8J57DRAFT_1592835 [Mycena rebaudengoi]|nr:hypothetical protein C8J57DRAFT_1592835 [Mycena rebaudengoi]